MLTPNRFLQYDRIMKGTACLQLYTSHDLAFAISFWILLTCWSWPARQFFLPNIIAKRKHWHVGILFLYWPLECRNWISMEWTEFHGEKGKECYIIHIHTYIDYWPIKKGNGNKYNLLFLNGIYLVYFYKRHLQYKINPVYWTNDEQQLSFYLYGNLSFRSSWLLLVYYLNKMY